MIEMVGRPCVTRISCRIIETAIFAHDVPDKKLLDQVVAACRTRHLARSTTKAYARLIEEYIRFHRRPDKSWQHPQDLSEREVEAFLTHLAVNRRVAESTQNQAFAALLFLYEHVLKRPLAGVESH